MNSPAGWHPDPSGREWKKRGNEIKSKNRKPLIIAGVVLGWIGLGVSVQHPWVLAVLVLVGGIGGVIWWMRRDEWMRRDDAKRARLAAHADYEDRLYYQGDPRGTYGRHMPPESPQDEDSTQERQSARRWPGPP